MSYKLIERVLERCILMTTDPGDLVLDPTCGSGIHRIRGRAVGATVDYHRHLTGRPGPCPRPHHGRPLPLLPARRQPRRAVEGIRTVPTGAPRICPPTATSGMASCTSGCPTSPCGPSPTTLRLTSSTRKLPGKAGTLAGTVKPGPRPELGRMGHSPGGGRPVDCCIAAESWHLLQSLRTTLRTY